MSRQLKSSVPALVFRHWLLVAWLALALPVAASAEEIVGRVVSAVGEVVAVRPDDDERTLRRRSEVFEGDTLITGEDGRLQVRFVDDGLVDLRPESELFVEAYSEATDDEGGNAVMEFTRGAMRTVTGRIGQQTDDDYEMGTAAATIGIRGTDYALQYCDDACVDAGGTAGLYGRVNSGAITVANLAGQADFEQGQFFSVADQNTLPIEITTPPQGTLDGNDDGTSALPDEDTEEVATPQQPTEIPSVDLDDEDREFAGLGRGVVSSELNPEPVDATELEPEPEPEPEPDPEPELPDIDGVMAGSGVGYGGEFFGGLIRRSDSEVDDYTVDNDTQGVLSAVFDSETGFEVLDPDSANLNINGDWTSPDGSAQVYWGTWSASSGDIEWTIEGDTSSPTVPRINFLYSEDVTTPEQLMDISGQITYDTTVVMESVDKSGSISSFSSNDTVLTVDFSALEAGVTMALEGNQGGETFNFDVDSGMQSVELFLLELSLEGSWTRDDSASGTLEGDMMGQFVSENADGVIISFELDQFDDDDLIESFIGSQLLTPDN